MLCDSSLVRPPEVDLYLVAGVRTAPLFMEGFRLALGERLEAAGRTVRSKLLFPYGDWTRGLVPQLREIRRDIGLAPGREDRSVGGNRVLDALGAAAMSSSASEPAPKRLFVGHSGGGVAAVHAARMLMEREGGSSAQVVMIGSPRCRIPPELFDSVLFVYKQGTTRRGASARPSSADPISLLGTFGGWSAAGRFRVPAWRTGKHAPAAIRPVPIAGGHADYFRGHPPYVGPDGRSNLELVLETVWEWLVTRGFGE